MRSAELARHPAARRCATLCLLALAACTRQSPPAERWLEVDQVRPEKNVGVFLNERIQLHFSEPLDPTSVNARSVRIRSSRDALARGELQVEEDNLIFVPDPVLAFDLSDGGYQPGTTYFVELAGFPRPDGLRGRSGAPLHHNVRWEFRTVEITEPRVDFVFEDSSPSRGLPVVLRSTNVAPGDPIVLEGEEPLDPSSLFAEDFVLRREKTEEQGDKVRAPLSEPIPLHARMLTNFDKTATHGRDTALIELTPINRLLEPGVYFLHVDLQRCRLQDFGGNRVPVWIRGPTRKPEVIVSPRAASGLEVSSEYLASFVGDEQDKTMRSLEAFEDFDGTAYWGDTGRVELHWPAAAGSGAAGAVTLGATEARRDIQATRLVVPEGVRCELDPKPGLCVLRAQGKLSIKGILSRRSRAVHTDAPALDGREMFTPPRGPDGAFPSLSAALARARELDFDATIVIAGGDLVVDGRIECDGPLLLVAGGRIRAAQLDTRWLYYLGEVGSALDLALPATLVPDPPTRNQLVEPLRFGAVSASIPPEGRAVRWHVAPRVGAHAGKGTVRVRYVGERAADGSGGPREIVVDDPGALTDCPTLRLRIELGMSPPVPPLAWWFVMSLPFALTCDAAPRDPEGLPWDAWDPPWVDYVLLELDQAPRGSR